MNDQIKISVILTSYNKCRYIGRAIESVLSQSYRDIELIIVDDGSTDDSVTVIKDYEEKDERIRVVIFEENRGIPSAHNTGIEMAQGEYCAMIDCDDFWEETKLEKQIELLENHKEYGACFTWIRVVDEEERYVDSEFCENRDVMWNSKNHSQGEWLKIFFTEGCKLGNPSMMVRKAVLDDVGSYSYGLKQLQDYDLFIRILKRCNVYVIPEALVNYRWFQGETKNTSFDNIESASRSNYEYYLICKNYFDNMSFEIFREGFDSYIKHDCITEEEMVFEKVFITQEYYLVPIVGKAVALENIYLLLNHDYFRGIMEQRYHMNSTAFANQIKEAIFYDEKYYIPKDENAYGRELEEKIEKLTKEWYKTVEYNKELTITTKDSVDYAERMKVYVDELEKNCREQNQLIGNQTKYIQELENKNREMSELYLKCNEYALSLEEKIRGS